MPNLDELVGEKIVFVPNNKFQPSDHAVYLVTLRAVETGGVWVEHPSLTKIVASALDRTPSQLPRDPVFFFPYSEISHIVTFSVRIDEAALGLEA